MTSESFTPIESLRFTSLDVLAMQMFSSISRLPDEEDIAYVERVYALANAMLTVRRKYPITGIAEGDWLNGLDGEDKQ